jgi:hypothetical protein
LSPKGLQFLRPTLNRPRGGAMFEQYAC